MQRILPYILLLYTGALGLALWPGDPLKVRRALGFISLRPAVDLFRRPTPQAYAIKARCLTIEGQNSAGQWLPLFESSEFCHPPFFRAWPDFREHMMFRILDRSAFPHDSPNRSAALEEAIRSYFCRSSVVSVRMKWLERRQELAAQNTSEVLREEKSWPCTP